MLFILTLLSTLTPRLPFQHLNLLPLPSAMIPAAVTPTHCLRVDQNTETSVMLHVLLHISAGKSIHCFLFFGSCPGGNYIFMSEKRRTLLTLYHKMAAQAQSRADWLITGCWFPRIIDLFKNPSWFFTCQKQSQKWQWRKENYLSFTARTWDWDRVRWCARVTSFQSQL